MARFLIDANLPYRKVLIEGHTDSKGSPDVNLELSKRRAEAVKGWLVKKKGVPDLIITTRGFGDTKPVTPNTNPDGSDDAQGGQQNRRVEITVEKTRARREIKGQRVTKGAQRGVRGGGELEVRVKTA